MESININSIDFNVIKETVTIIHIANKSSTETKTSGGGGSIKTSVWSGKVYGNISPVETTSRTTTLQEVHYTDVTGKENFVQFQNIDLPLREGQELDLVSISGKGIDILFFLGIHNLRQKYKLTQNYNAIVDNIFQTKYKNWYALTLLAVALLIGIVPALIHGRFFTILLDGILVYILYFLSSKIHKSIIRSKVNATIDKIWDAL